MGGLYLVHPTPLPTPAQDGSSLCILVMITSLTYTSSLVSFLSEIVLHVGELIDANYCELLLSLQIKKGNLH